MLRRTILAATGIMTFALVCGSAGLNTNGQTSKADKAALERTRKTVRMLDDIYKQTIVLITDKYVTGKRSYPAGRAAIRLFKNISKNGWHEVTLLDVSGDPSNPNNVADDAFEKAGIKQLKQGKTYYEEIVTKNGKQYLRAMTFVPVVMDKCIMCHSNYAKAKKNEAVGALSYIVPIE